jgi:hypothetical protein
MAEREGMTGELEWYGVKVLYRAFTKRGHKFALAEESVRVIRARSFEHAEVIAKQWAPEWGEDEFVVGTHRCDWEGPEVLDVFVMGEDPAEGAEVYSNIMTPVDAKRLKRIYPDE